MKNYTVKGLYNSYDKNHKERDALDYYATPTEEVIKEIKRLNDFGFKLALDDIVDLNGIMDFIPLILS